MPVTSEDGRENWKALFYVPAQMKQQRPRASEVVIFERG